MSEPVALLAALLLSYLLGSIPSGFLLTRWSTGKDIRKLGSGNIGFTNVLRNAGKPAAILTLVFDAGKGWLAIAAICRWCWGWGGGGAISWEFFQVGTFMAVVAGHIFTPWLGFRGGKGIATGAGALLSLAPVVFLAGAGVWVILVIFSRYISLGSIVAAAVFPILMMIFGYPPVFIVFSGVLAVLIIFRHKKNLIRMLRGEEARLEKKTPGDKVGLTPGGER